MTNRRFVPSLESARGLAALTVCLFHASELPFQGTVVLAKNMAAGVFLNGHGAVVLFFVLSGFVLRSSLEKNIKAATPALAADFLIARFFRLFPVIMASVALFLCVAWVVHGSQPQLGFAIKNALLLDTTINGAFWTLQVEVFGSIIVLAAFLLERRYGVSAVAAMLVALLPLSFFGAGTSIGPVWPGFFYTFLLGYLIFLVPPLPADWSRLATILLMLALTTFYTAYAFGYVLKQWLLLVTALSSGLIVLVLSSASYREHLQWPPIRLLGTVSYAFYAVHPLGLQLDGALRTSLEQAAWPSWFSVGVMLVVPVMVAAALAIPMYRWVERPGIAWAGGSLERVSWIPFMNVFDEVKASLRRMLRAPVGFAARWMTRKLAVQKTNELAVCAIFREEAPFLDEWITFHVAVGAGHFYLYDNYSTDNFRQVLEPWIARGTVTLIDWPKPVGQLAAYRNCIRRTRRIHRWVAFLDVDEFLFSPRATDIRDILRRYEDLPGIEVWEAFFGSGGHDTRPALPVTEAYLKRAPLSRTTVKTIANPRMVYKVGVHQFKYWLGEALDPSRRRVAKNQQPMVDALRINHYWSRSLEDLRMKVRRGDASTPVSRDSDWHFSFEKTLNSETDEEILPIIREIRSRANL